ncbi:MAG: hypothetical protein QM783_05675 [Phycisphaerales bacterium]
MHGNINREVAGRLLPGVVVCGLLAFASPVKADLDLFASAGVNDAGMGVSVVTHDGTTAQAVGTPGGINALAYASASFGVLHGYSHAISSGTTGYAWAASDASFTDTITITGGVGTGYFTTDFTVEGTLFNGGGFPAAGLSFPGSSGVVSLTSGMNVLHGTSPIAFTYGVSFSISAELLTHVIFGSAGTVGEGFANFGNTAWMSGITVFNNDFQPVSGFTVTSQSGTNYLTIPSAGPAALMGVGGLCAARRRRAV